jgi:hypothetical protein
MIFQNYTPKFSLPNIVARAKADVTGDTIPDHVYLTGTYSSESPFTQNITLVIQDGSTGIFHSIPLKENSGYNPSLFLGDFTGDGVCDILIGIASGGSGGTMYYTIYSFLHHVPRLLFDFSSYNKEYTYDVTYLDDYKVEVFSHKNYVKYILDISYKGSQYLNEIYDKKRQLKDPITGFANPISGLYPIDFDGNGVFELLGFQKIAGRYNADSLGYIQNTLKWMDPIFRLDHQFLAILGTQESTIKL